MEQLYFLVKTIAAAAASAREHQCKSFHSLIHRDKSNQFLGLSDNQIIKPVFFFIIIIGTSSVKN